MGVVSDCMISFLEREIDVVTPLKRSIGSARHLLIQSTAGVPWPTLAKLLGPGPPAHTRTERPRPRLNGRCRAMLNATRLPTTTSSRPTTAGADHRYPSNTVDTASATNGNSTV